MLKQNWKNWLNNKGIKKKDKTKQAISEKKYFASLPKMTNGFRAPMVLGINSFNEYTIKVIIIAFCQSMTTAGQKIIICHDQRKWSKQISEQISNILHQFHIKTYLFTDNQVVPTPFLSYLLKKNNPTYHHGIMITASHNKKEINGLKFMDNNGFQWTSAKWQTLHQLIKKNYWTFLVYPLPKNINKPFILKLAQKNEYLKQIQKIWADEKPTKKQTKILFSSLHGTTKGWTDVLLRWSGYQVYLVEEQCQVSSDFPTLNDPNPEDDNTFNLALEKTQKQSVDLIILNDCDGDRMRVACKNKAKDFYKFSGNEIAIIFTYFLLKEKKQRGYIYRSLVSTALVDKIAQDFDSVVIPTNSGFNNLGQIYQKKAEKSFILAFEESIGFLPSLKINKDKDGLQAALLICQIAEFCQKKKQTLLDYLENIYQKYGYTYHQTLRQELKIINWTNWQQQFINIKTIDGFEIIERKTIIKNKFYFLKLNNNATIALRRSQTEAIIKIYFNIYGESPAIKSTLQKIINNFCKQMDMKVKKIVKIVNMKHYQMHNGFIELIVGCMFAGKTEELIRRISVLKRGKRKVLVFKPQFDNRQKQGVINSHSGAKIESFNVKTVAQVEAIIKQNQTKIDVLAFDEVQFFNPEFCAFWEQKAQEGYQIICAGLDKGFNDKLFTTTMRLLAMAEFVTKLMAVCVLCGDMATKTQRINKDKKAIGPKEVINVIGGEDVYQARCRKCYKHFPD